MSCGASVYSYADLTITVVTGNSFDVFQRGTFSPLFTAVLDFSCE